MGAMLGPALRMLVSLAIVLALMYIAARLMQRTRGGGPRRMARPAGLASLRSGLARASSGRPRPERSPRRRTLLEVIARQPLSKSASVAVVRVGDRTLLVGVTDSAVHLLTEVEATPSDDAAAVPALAVVGDDAATTPAAGRSQSVQPVPASVLDALRERTVRRA